MLEKEKQMSGSCDGLISRFLVSAAKPIRLSLDQTSNQRKTVGAFTVDHLFFGLYTLNKNLIKSKEVGTCEKQFLKFDETAFVK